MDTVNTELIRGHVDTIILNSLAERDRYGYEILDIISDLSEGRYEIKQPTLYSCLKRLEKQGFIDSYYGDESNGGRRRYYKLTDKGRETLEQDQREWEFSRTIINKLLSDKEIDLKTVEAPFDPNELRPLTRRVKAHDANDEVASAVLPTQNADPIIKYVYVPQYIHVPAGESLPQNGTLPEGAVFTSLSEVPDGAKVENLTNLNEADEKSANKTEVESPVERERPIPSFSFFSAFNDEKEVINTPTEQEALNALYADPTSLSSKSEDKDKTSSGNIELMEAVNDDKPLEDKEEVDEETALIIKEQQTKASKLLGIGEFARHRNLLEDPTESQEGQNNEENPSSSQKSSQPDLKYAYDNATENVNYREALSAFFGKESASDVAIVQSSAIHQAEVERVENSQKARHFGDVKQSLYEDGFKLKVYQKANSLNHYYLKFIYSNRINRDTALLTYLMLVVELLVMIIAKKVFGAPLTYIIIGAVGIIIPLIPTLVWATNPTKRIRAQFNLTQSLANSFIAFIIICAITIVVSLLLDVNMKTGSTYAPIIIASNIPIGVAIYGLLYKSNNYHLKK